ncbi:post-GPI attachment to proteins factor 2-like [Ixodes scapularis]|uniref:FGF receptor activating protein, putative n=1 Tax=Ixodes scapularis TaxID=6945 RepID=B7QH05_IXOSC|nr:post-GPI attachment to proteins factor 2-like [Ixodes scapularis]EEC18127.1 FGF receptor activating protein, putative [Ixodes scapularis]|eukprot:XP_002414462.1 FGF receptor activating protein, putative [Ixodes scapularis]
METPIPMEHVLLRVKVLNLAYLTVALPLFTLVFCFATSMLFQYTAVNTTVCKVYNFCPSVSAITGISPQRYVWRTGVALHTGPRLLLASLYPRYYSRRALLVEAPRRPLFLRLARANYLLHLTEALSLVGVTYVSNRENYPVHEKIFIIFMVSSLLYMVGTCIAANMCQHKNDTEMEKKSRRLKMSLLGLTLAASAGMLYFFYKHRIHCVELAFSWFSLCEYVICVCNMAFHLTLVYDIPDEELLVGIPLGVANSSKPASKDQ